MGTSQSAAKDANASSIDVKQDNEATSRRAMSSRRARGDAEGNEVVPEDLFSFLDQSSHRKRLKSLDMENDIKFCLSPDISSFMVPFFENDRLIPIVSNSSQKIY